MSRKKIPLFVWILTAMLAGIAFGVIATLTDATQFTAFYVKPWGVIFINLLKMVAMPLIFFSLVKGISDLKDISSLSKMGLKTMLLYLCTTLLAVGIGLVLVNAIKPGRSFPGDNVRLLETRFEQTISNKQQSAGTFQEQGPLQFVVDIVPENIVTAASDNKLMLQMIFVSMLIGIAMISLPEQKTVAFKKLVDSLNDIVLKIIDMIMYTAPFGVFALMASVITDIAQGDITQTGGLFTSLSMYALAVVTGMVLLLFVVYPVLIKVFAGISPLRFMKGVFPAQLVAFSTSSSAATLPVTKKCAEENLKVNKEVTSFVLPLGATVNMDGTSLYQAVAAVFIAQAYGIDLSITQQLTILLTATLASIGSAAVPGAGMVMLAVILGSIHVPIEGIALIFAIDRPLDMLRTTVNITGDSLVACIVNRKYKVVKLNSA